MNTKTIIENLQSIGRTPPPALLVYIGIAVSMLGILPVLAAMGVIGDDPIEPLGIIFAFLFGAIFGGGGGFVLYLGLANAMELRLGRSRPFFLSLMQLVWSRVNRQTLYAAIPNLVLASMIICVILDVMPWVTRSDLRHLVVLEFFAIHSTAFLGMIAFVRWTSWGGLAIIPQLVLFLGFLCLYVFAAYQAAGLVGAISFAVLTLSKYVSYAVKPLNIGQKGVLALRWFTGLIIFMIVASFFDVDLEAQDNLVFAATYFTVLALFEVFDLMAPTSKSKNS